MGVDGLEEPQCDPSVNRDDMQVTREEAVDQRTEDSSSPQNEDLSWVCVFSSQAEWRRVLMVDFVDVFIKHASVKCLMS